MRPTIPATAILPVHNIDTSEDFATIQEAIDDPDTLDGHTILVDAGTYYEHVVVNKPLSLIGENTTTTIVDGGGIGNVTEVKVGNVAIEGFTIKDSGTSWPNGGIALGNVKNCFISGNILTGNRRGIALFGASNNSISGNILTNNLEGIVLSDSSNNNISGNKITGSHIGFSCWGSFNNEILRNKITNNEDCGIELWFSSKNVIQENNITENTEHGIQLVMSFNNTLRGNRIADNRYNFDVYGNLTELVNDVDTSNTVDGKPIYYWVNERYRAVPSDAGCVALVNCTNITVENLTLKNNWEGVLLAYTTNSTIIKNNITNNVAGIDLWFSHYNNITGNNITNNEGSGIGLSDSSNNIISGNNITNNGCVVGLCEASDNRFYHNNFIENMGLIVIPIGDYEPSKNVWDDGYQSGGNYWSNYTGTDANHDGIGDIPYIIDENNRDRYPLMYPWSPFPVNNINTGLGYARIQEAIDANETLEGHVIFVEEGTYYEHVIVNKTVSLIGERRETTIIDGGGYGTVVNIWADGVKISNFNVRNIGTPSPELPPPMDGISAHFSNGKISNNIIEHNGDGIALVFSTNNTITGNRVPENEYGICLDDSNNNTIASNDVSSNKKHGIYLWWDSNNNTLTDNKVSENEYGIYFDHSSNNALTDNEVSNNDYGIHLHHSPENILIGNEVLNNEYGIYLNSSRINSIHHNNFVNNTYQTYAFDSYNSWDDDYPSGGNHWSDYEERYPNATEIDDSGIWDTPYVIDENNQDNYPLVPEFPTWTSMLLILIVLTIAIAIYKRRLNRISFNAP